MTYSEMIIKRERLFLGNLGEITEWSCWGVLNYKTKM